jgi:SNF family Na+-dependent transporter
MKTLQKWNDTTNIAVNVALIAGVVSFLAGVALFCTCFAVNKKQQVDSPGSGSDIPSSQLSRSPSVLSVTSNQGQEF